MNSLHRRNATIMGFHSPHVEKFRIFIEQQMEVLSGVILRTFTSFRSLLGFREAAQSAELSRHLEEAKGRLSDCQQQLRFAEHRIQAGEHGRHAADAHARRQRARSEGRLAAIGACIASNCRASKLKSCFCAWAQRWDLTRLALQLVVAHGSRRADAQMALTTRFCFQAWISAVVEEEYIARAAESREAKSSAMQSALRHGLRRLDIWKMRAWWMAWAGASRVAAQQCQLDLEREGRQAELLRFQSLHRLRVEQVLGGRTLLPDTSFNSLFTKLILVVWHGTAHKEFLKRAAAQYQHQCNCEISKSQRRADDMEFLLDRQSKIISALEMRDGPKSVQEPQSFSPALWGAHSNQREVASQHADAVLDPCPAPYRPATRFNGGVVGAHQVLTQQTTPASHLCSAGHLDASFHNPSVADPNAALLFPENEEDWRALVAHRRVHERISRVDGHSPGPMHERLRENIMPCAHLASAPEIATPILGSTLLQKEAPALLSLASEASMSEQRYQELLSFHRQRRAWERRQEEFVKLGSS